MHVTQIESNILSPNGQSYSFQLGRLTLLTGRNGSGKTALSTVLRLALTGTTDDLVGRSEVKDPQLLARLLPEGAPHPLFATVTFNDSGTAHWGLVVEPDGTIKRPQHEPHPGVDQDRVLALRAVWSLLQGDEKIARRTLLTWIGQNVSEEDVLAHIPAHLHGKFRDIAEKQPGSVVDKVVAVAEYAAQRARETEADASAQERLVDQLSGAMALKPSTAALEEARVVVGQWQTLYEQARNWEEPPSVEVYQEKRKALLAAEEAVEQWEQAFELSEGGDPQRQRHEMAAALLDTSTCSGGKCPVCGASSTPPTLRAWAEWHADQARALAPADTQQHEARMALHGWREEAARLQKEVAFLEGQQVALEGRSRPPLPLSDCETGLRAAEAHLSELERSAGNWETVQRAKGAAAELRSSKPAYQELSAACNKAVADLLDQLTEAFCARAQTYLPDRWKIGLRIRDGFEIGFVRGERLHTLLSGTEYDALSVAVTMAVADLGGGASPKKKRGRPAKTQETKEVYTLVIPADRGRDAETLGELMRCWAKFSGQVVVEAPEPPKGRISKDWTIIDVEAWRAALTTTRSGGEDVRPPMSAQERADEILRQAAAEGDLRPSAFMAGRTGLANCWETDTVESALWLRGREAFEELRMSGVVVPAPPPPEEAPIVEPPKDYGVDLMELGFKPEEVELLRHTPVGREIAEGKVKRPRVLISRDNTVIIFNQKGQPGKPYALGVP